MRKTPLWLALAIAGCTATPLVETKSIAPAPVTANPASGAFADTDRDQAFARWISDFKTTAGAAGIDAATLHSAFDTVRFIPRVIELDRSQPEFTRNVWDYLDSAVSPLRVQRGQEKLQQLRSLMDATTARYGVPAETLLAIWGVESNFGTHVGDFPAIDALATLGFEGRRAQWARGQLLAALKILQNGDISRAHMVGSWAGAMGQTQFLPSVFLNDAVDADGDGKRDIWGSLPDVMASTANFIAKAGWKPGQPWGLEVRLPKGFDYGRADADVRQHSSAWANEGVRSMDGKPLPTLPESTILLPAGARGPAFLVGNNYRTILRYNNATSYALAVNLLAQRLSNGPTVQAAWPRDLPALSRSQMMALQTALNAQGFDSGTPDGVAGPATQRSIRSYQRSLGLPTDGYPTLDLLLQLQP